MAKGKEPVEFKVVAMSHKDAEEIVSWNYPDPYAIYSLSPNVIPILKNPSKRYFAVLDTSDSLIGYCCFGEEARVVGGEYEEMDESVLDVGVGLQPERTGEGLGKSFVSAILRFARVRYKPERFRVTMAHFNKRSMCTFQSLGFVETFGFNRPDDSMRFIQLERAVGWAE